jgi:UDP-N-acetyl-D-mannosaminuronic acid dehydrogenase/UDP-N-acetyl-D-glucosamine dehydrogenase
MSSGFDVDAERVQRLARAESFIDDVSDDDLRGVLATGRFRPSSDARDLAGFDVAVISVPTPAA